LLNSGWNSYLKASWANSFFFFFFPSSRRLLNQRLSLFLIVVYCNWFITREISNREILRITHFSALFHRFAGRTGLKLEREGEHKRDIDGRSVTDNIYQVYLLPLRKPFLNLSRYERTLICAVKEVNADKTETDFTYATDYCVLLSLFTHFYVFRKKKLFRHWNM